jgi:hypothetical protein
MIATTNDAALQIAQELYNNGGRQQEGLGVITRGIESLGSSAAMVGGNAKDVALQLVTLQIMW